MHKTTGKTLLAPPAGAPALGILAAVLALALLAAGPAQAQQVELTGPAGGDPNGVPSRVTGTAEPGPAPGQITLRWTPGPVDANHPAVTKWQVGYRPPGSRDYQRTDISDASVRMHTFTGLAKGGIHNVFVAPVSGFTTGHAVDADVRALLQKADAGADVAAAEGARVELDGTGSDGPPGTTYAWTQTGGPEPAAPLAGADTATPSFDAPEEVTADTTLTFRLTVSNGTETDTDTVTVTVLPWEVTGASARGDTLSVVFDRALDERARPLGGVFTVTATKDGSSRRIRGTVTAVSGRQVTARLSEAVAADERLTLRYDRPARGAALALKSPAGGAPLPGFSFEPVGVHGATRDTTAPYFVSGTATATTVTLTFSEALDSSTSGLAPPNHFLRHTSQADVFPQGGATTTISGRTVTLSGFRQPLVHGATVRVQYIRPTSAQLKDLAGNEVKNTATESDWWPITNVTPLAFSSAAVSGTGLTVTFDGALDPGSAPAGSAFTLTATKTGSSRTIAGTSASAVVTGATVDVVLSSAPAADETVTVAYAKPTASPLRSATDTSHEVAAFSGEAVASVTAADGTAPTFVSGTVNGATAKLVFSELLDTASKPVHDAWYMSVDGGSPINNVKSTVIAGRTVTYSLFSAVTHGQAIRMALGLPATPPLQDRAGNDVTGGPIVSGVDITNVTPPTFSSAAVNGASLVLTFDGALDAGSVPAASAFTVKATRGGTEITMALAATGAVALSGAAVTLTLAEPLLSTDTAVKVSYVPGANRLRDAAGNFAAAFADRAVTNSTPADIVAPRFVSGTINGRTVVLTFSEALDETVATSDGDYALLSPVAATNNSTSRSISGRTLTVTFPYGVTYGLRARVRYIPVVTTRLRDLSGNQLPGVKVWTMTNITPPRVSSATVNGATLALTFEAALDAGSRPAGSAFTVTATSGGTSRTIAGAATPVGVSGETVTVALSEGVRHGETVTVAYARPASSPLRDAANAAAVVGGFTGRSVTNETSAHVAGTPSLSAAAVDGATVTLTFDRALDESSVPAAGAFTVTVTEAGAAATPASVAVAGATVTLALPSAVTPGQTVAVAYARPSANPLQSRTGEAVASFANAEARTGPPEATIVSAEIVSTPSIDTDSTGTPGHGTPDTYGAGEYIQVRVTWSADVAWYAPGATVDNTAPLPRLKLALGSRTVDAPLLAGGADYGRARSLLFGYKVEAADRDTDGVVITSSEADGFVVLPAGTTLMSRGRDASRAHAELPGGAVHKVNGGRPPAAATPPEVVHAVVDSRTVTLTFDEDLKKMTEDELDRMLYKFFVQGTRYDGAVIVNVSPVEVAVSGPTVTLGLGGVAVTPHQTATVRYEAARFDANTRLRNAAGNAAVADFTVEAANATAVVGEEPPAILRGSVEGRTLSLIFDRGLDAGSRPSGTRFTVDVRQRSAADKPFGSVEYEGTGRATISGSLVTVVLNRAPPYDSSTPPAKPLSSISAWVAYDKGDETRPLRDANGVEVGAVDQYRVPILEGKGPGAPSGSVSGKHVTLHFDEELDAGSVPAVGAFTVTVGGASASAIDVAVRGTAVFLILDREAAGTDAVTVAYNKGVAAASPLQDLVGADVGNFSAIALTNEGTARPAAAPAICSASSTAAVCGAAAKANPVKGTARKVTLAFDQVLDPAHAPEKSAFSLSHSFTGVQRVVVNGATVDLHLVKELLPCDAGLELQYAAPAGSALQNRWGMRAGSFGPQEVQNTRSGQCTSGGMSGMSGAGGSMSMSFDGGLSKRGSPAASHFAVTGASPVTVVDTAYSTDGRALLLGLDRALAVGEQVTVRYRRSLGAVGLWTADGKQVADFDAETTAGDGTPAVTAVAVVSEAGTDNTYGLGDTIRVQVTFNQAVTVTGTPRLAIDMDPAHWGKKRASYESGSGTRNLVFAHEVVEPNYSTQGIAVLANSLETGGGTIRSGGADAVLAHEGLAHDAGHKVDWRKPPAGDGSRDTTPPRLVGGEIDGGTMTLTFSEALDPASAGGKFWVQVQTSRSSSTGFFATGAVTLDGDTATVELGDGNPRATAGLADRNRVAYYRPVDPAAGTLRDLAGNPVATPLTPLGEGMQWRASVAVELRNVTVATTAAATGVSVVSAPASGDTYMLGETVRIRVNFNAAVAVTGSPGLSIDMDPAAWGEKRAAYESGSGTSSLVFAHTVVEPNYSAQGIAVLANSLAPGGGTIRSAASGTDAALAHGGLGHDSGHKVDWRPAVSVADAEANEGADATVDFEVSLSRAFTSAGHRVTVDYATADGTATAGEDYAATSGTLTFAPGESSKTVRVPVLDDAVDEGEETFSLRLSNATGARLGDAEATGTIVNTDEMPRAWLARFGRAAAEHVAGAIGERLRGSPATRVTLGGQELDLGANPDALPANGSAPLTGPDINPRLTGGGPLLANSNGFESGRNGRTGEDAAAARELSMPDLLLASSFHMASAGGGSGSASGRWSAWGRGARSSFEGAEGRLRLEGDVTTATLGMDYERGPWLAGVALSRSSGEGSYEEGDMRGEVESVLTGVYPYARYRVSESLSLWGVVGFGAGDMTLEPEGRSAIETDIDTGMAAAGARGVLLPARAAGGLELALRADLMATATSSDAASNLVETEVETSRLRLLLEASRSFRVGAEGVLTPSAEIGLRYDGGDAETGSGLEMGGSLRWTSGGLSIEIAARGLMAHSEDDYEEWGVSGSVRYAQNPDGRGFSLKAGSAFGAAAGGAERLWSQRPGALGGGLSPGAGLDAEAGYGFDFRGGLLTPYTGVALSDSGDTWRAGARWKLGAATEVSLEANLTEPASGDDPESGILLKGSRRW